MKVAWPAPGSTRIYELGRLLEHGIPRHPVHPPFLFSLTKRHGDVMYAEGVTAAADIFTTGGHTGTHIDALGHVARHLEVHGGASMATGQSWTAGLPDQSIDLLPPLIGCAYLVDMTVQRGERMGPDEAIGPDDFERWFATHPGPESGSTVLVRTGWDELWDVDSQAYVGTSTGTPGVDLGGARWLTDRGVAATGADTLAYEKMPSASIPVHVHLLKEAGVPILEALDLRGLAADSIYEFFLVALPLRIRGGTGSPIRPLAFAPSRV
jgi:kynurenine formamidase